MLEIYLKSVAFYLFALFLCFWCFFPCIKMNGWLEEATKEVLEEYDRIISGGILRAFLEAAFFCWIPIIRSFYLIIFTFAAFISIDKIRGNKKDE